MKIINKYVLKEHVGPFFFALTAATSLMLLQYIARQFSDLVGKGLGWGVIAEFFVLSIPFTVAMTLPMSVLVAVLYAFSRFGSENEITALKSGGVSTRSLMNPVLLTAFGLSLAMLWFNDQVLPKSNHRLETLTNDIMKTKPTFGLHEQVINTIQDQRIYLQAGHIDQETQRMSGGVTIWDLTDQSRRRTIIGQRGIIVFAPNNRDIELTLFDGVILSVPTAQPDQLDRLYYHENRMRVRDVASAFQQSSADSTAKGEREMSVCEMQNLYVRAAADVDHAFDNYQEDAWIAHGRQGPAPAVRRVVPARGIGYYYCTLMTNVGRQLHRLGVKTASAAELPVQVQQGLPPPSPPLQGRPRLQEPPPVATPQPATPPPPSANPRSDIQSPPNLTPGRSFVDLPSEALQWKALRQHEARFAIEIEKKFSLAAACIVLALVGAPIALRFPRGGVGLVIGVSFTIFALFYVCLIAGESLANNLVIAPFWAMWAANVIFGSIGLVLYARMGHEVATSRGGSAAELVAQMRLWFSRSKGPSSTPEAS